MAARHELPDRELVRFTCPDPLPPVPLYSLSATVVDHDRGRAITGWFRVNPGRPARLLLRPGAYTLRYHNVRTPGQRRTLPFQVTPKVANHFHLTP